MQHTCFSQSFNQLGLINASISIQVIHIKGLPDFFSHVGEVCVAFLQFRQRRKEHLKQEQLVFLQLERKTGTNTGNSGMIE